VFSNAKNYRMVEDVPLIVPPVNGDHVALVTAQPSFRASGGFIVTNANCSTTGLVSDPGRVLACAVVRSVRGAHWAAPAPGAHAPLTSTRALLLW
jgi:hypothetical protein